LETKIFWSNEEIIKALRKKKRRKRRRHDGNFENLYTLQEVCSDRINLHIKMKKEEKIKEGK
jgi:NifU-like protein involved in Fe-S cluster formation